MAAGYFQLQDLYAAGIGFDLGGAFLLATGLIMAPRKLTQVAGSYFGGNDYLAASVATDRLNAISGIAGLFVGFASQLLGYLLALAVVNRQTYGWREAAVAGLLAAVAFVVALCAGWVHRKVRLRPTLVEMAHYQGDGTRLDHPRAEHLVRWARRGLGIPQGQAESDLIYLRRVFGVDAAVVAVVGGFRPLAADERQDD